MPLSQGEYIGGLCCVSRRDTRRNRDNIITRVEPERAPKQPTRWPLHYRKYFIFVERAVFCDTHTHIVSEHWIGFFLKILCVSTHRAGRISRCARDRSMQLNARLHERGNVDGTTMYSVARICFRRDSNLWGSDTRREDGPTREV